MSTPPQDDLLTADVVADLISSLVGIDSQNPELVAGGAGEREIAAWCVAWLQSHGVDAWVEDVAPDRCNAVARVTGGTGPTLALCAHLDTVSVDGMTDALRPHLANGRLRGRGAYDMKSGVAAILAALAQLQRRPPRGTVLAALVADEEYASIGAQHFVAHHPVDACIVTEPSELQLILAHKGFVWVELITTGFAAHGSRWQEGVSAVAAMGRIIAALDEFDRTVLRQRTHALLGPASLHCALVEGGSGWSTYAPDCTLRVERRTLPGETAEQVLSEISTIVAAAGEDAALRVVLTRSPLECDPASPVARALREAATSTTNAAPAEAGVAYWMDAAIFADAGAATVNYGATGAGAHGAEEWVDVASVVTCARVITRAAESFCNGDGGSA